MNTESQLPNIDAPLKNISSRQPQRIRSKNEEKLYNTHRSNISPTATIHPIAEDSIKTQGGKRCSSWETRAKLQRSWRQKSVSAKNA